MKYNRPLHWQVLVAILGGVAGTRLFPLTQKPSRSEWHSHLATLNLLRARVF